MGVMYGQHVRLVQVLSIQLRIQTMQTVGSPLFPLVFGRLGFSQVFKACADFGVQLEAVLLKPSMVTPGAQSGHSAEPETVASYTLRSLKRVVPPAVPRVNIEFRKNQFDLLGNLQESPVWSCQVC